MVLTTPFAAPPDLTSLYPAVSPLEDGLDILTSGLFPHDCLCQTVWVKDNGLPTKYGRRPMSWGELAMLWDVLILFLDLFDKSSEDLTVMERLLALPPGKFSEVGTDQLLTDYFRGGWECLSRGHKGETKA